MRGEHATGHPRRATFVASVHTHSPTVQRGTARDRKPDDAAADNGE
jgi:hypothetical protein